MPSALEMFTAFVGSLFVSHARTYPTNSAPPNFYPWRVANIKLELRSREVRLDRTRQDETGRDRTRQDETGRDRTRQDETGRDRTRQDETGRDGTDCTVTCKRRDIRFHCKIKTIFRC
jgi:hypothetical protein